MKTKGILALLNVIFFSGTLLVTGCATQPETESGYSSSSSGLSSSDSEAEFKEDGEAEEYPSEEHGDYEVPEDVESEEEFEQRQPIDRVEEFEEEGYPFHNTVPEFRDQFELNENFDNNFN